MTRSLRVLAGLVVLGLIAAGCASKSGSGSTATTSAAKKFLACEVTDTGGIDDRSFNASAWLGMQNAHSANPNITVAYLSSTSANSYAPNINAFVQRKCGIIVTVGFLMISVTHTAAKANPNIHFAIVDDPGDTGVPSNLKPLSYLTNQSAFLGGYLAAGMTKSGKVGTFGGINIPTVTIYMNGFVAGVWYYNKVHHTHVTALGWNPQTKNGLFTGDFTNQDNGKRVTQTLMGQGADIIFPVAGSVGLGAAAAVQQAGGSNAMEWVDTDGCVSAPQYCPLFITSVEKGIAASVSSVVEAAASGNFKGGEANQYVGTLKNNGVGIAPYHDWASKVPSSLTTEINGLKAGIINGTISVNPLTYAAYK